MSNTNRQENPGIAAVPAPPEGKPHTKPLSPTMLVFRRFIKNRLAAAGFIITAVMFVFSFAGPLFMPYGETQQFMKVENEPHAFAGATYNNNFYYTPRSGHEFTSVAKAAFIMTVNNGSDSFSAQAGESDVTYYIEKFSDITYLLSSEVKVASFRTVAKTTDYTEIAPFELSSGFIDAANEAVSSDDGKMSFVYADEEYFLFISKRSSYIYQKKDAVLLSKNVFTPYEKGGGVSYELALAASEAERNGQDSFTLNGENYLLEKREYKTTVLKMNPDGEFYDVADISGLTVTPAENGIFLPVSFRDTVDLALRSNAETFEYTDGDGETSEYSVERKDTEYVIRTVKPVDLLDTYSPPGRNHPAGTDGYGMDLMVRLMYGGRVSLTVGFVVVFIEMVIGVIAGGISGYFGGWADTVIMRIVDAVNCIPDLPLYLIIGAVLSTLKISPSMRIYMLMIVLGITGWTEIARVVRGQILSLREQEFMVAAEVLGLSHTRRIFRHLLPNVVPQVIVYATRSLGGIILTEATLSFLNLGIRYPHASWGNIVSSVNDIYVMTNYAFVWVPAGFLILITVLGFNFIGDGLRDAFDPKMKR